MNKNEFLMNEFITLTLMGGLSTRNKKYPVYRKDVNSDPFKKYLRKKLTNISEKYRNQNIKEEELVNLINELSKDATEKFQDILHENHFRIGISQKIINLFLKYLWCLDWIKEPPHCPFDSIIKNKLNCLSLIDWTKLDTIDDYKKYTEVVFQIANAQGKSIAQWELEMWNPNL